MKNSIYVKNAKARITSIAKLEFDSTKTAKDNIQYYFVLNFSFPDRLYKYSENDEVETSQNKHEIFGNTHNNFKDCLRELKKTIKNSGLNDCPIKYTCLPNYDYIGAVFTDAKKFVKISEILIAEHLRKCQKAPKAE